MNIVAHSRPFVIGVDTHTKSHTYAVIDATNGQLLRCQHCPTTAKGMARAVAWAGRISRGEANTLWVIEGTASYGSQLVRIVIDADYEAVEAPRMNARNRRRVGKSDPLDAQAIAAAALPLTGAQLRRPRTDTGVRQALRIFVTRPDDARENNERERDHRHRASQ